MSVFRLGIQSKKRIIVDFTIDIGDDVSVYDYEVMKKIVIVEHFEPKQRIRIILETSNDVFSLESVFESDFSIDLIIDKYGRISELFN